MTDVLLDVLEIVLPLARRRFGGDPSAPGVLTSLLPGGAGYASLVRFREDRGGGKVVVLNHLAPKLFDAVLGLGERALLSCLLHEDCRDAVRRYGAVWSFSADRRPGAESGRAVNWERVAVDPPAVPLLRPTVATACFNERGRLRTILDEESRASRPVSLVNRLGVLCLESDEVMFRAKTSSRG